MSNTIPNISEIELQNKPLTVSNLKIEKKKNLKRHMKE